MKWFFRKSIDETIQAHKNEIFKKRGVYAIVPGTKITKGVDTKKECITIFVRTKFPENMLLEAEKVPKKIGGYLTDILDLGGVPEPMNVSEHRRKHKIIIGGISGKCEGGSAGSIGLIVWKDNKKHILTNEHVAHFQRDMTGKRFLQPSPADKGTMLDAIGTITYPPRIKNSQQNKIDSHIVPLDVASELKVLGLPDYKKQWVKPQIGTHFTISSRTLGITKGVITHINAIAKVNMGGNLGVCEFYPCFFALQNNFNIVAGGSSGSCVFNEDGVIGQTFAAAPNLAIFLTGEEIGKELGITLEKKEPEIGFVALGRHLSISNLEITTQGRMNFREEPSLSGKIIKTLSRGTKLKVIETGKIADNFLWVKVELKVG